MISCSANLKRQFLQRNLRTCNRDIKLQCYKTYVRPIIEYASLVWDTSNKNVIQKVESVQRKAARFIFNDYNKDSSVLKMMKKLNLDSIELRRTVKKLYINIHIYLNLNPTIEIVNGQTERTNCFRRKY